MFVLKPSLTQICSFQVTVSIIVRSTISLQYLYKTYAWICCQRKYLSNLSWHLQICIHSVTPHKGKVSTYPLGNKGI